MCVDAGNRCVLDCRPLFPPAGFYAKPTPSAKLKSEQMISPRPREDRNQHPKNEGGNETSTNETDARRETGWLKTPIGVRHPYGPKGPLPQLFSVWITWPTKQRKTAAYPTRYYEHEERDRRGRIATGPKEDCRSFSASKRHQLDLKRRG